MQNTMRYVYLIKCNDSELYTGCTNDLKERIERHQNGHVPATATRLPIELISYTAIADKYKAYEFEKYLKSGSGRAFIKKHLWK
jgi:predicted GIY-YIG superfamily endonuclease